MEKLQITICKSKDQYGAYAENVNGIYAAGNTVAECKKDILDAIALLVKHNGEGMNHAPQWLIDGDYSIEYRYDIAAFYEERPYLNVSQVAKYIGINDTLMRQYKRGQYISEAQVQRIQEGIHRIGRELSNAVLFA